MTGGENQGKEGQSILHSKPLNARDSLSHRGHVA
jgi:hypothetical protein